MQKMWVGGFGLNVALNAYLYLKRPSFNAMAH